MASVMPSQNPDSWLILLTWRDWSWTREPDIFTSSCAILFLKDVFYFLYMCIRLSLCIGCLYMSIGASEHQRCQISWSWNDRWLWATLHVCWESDSAPLQEQYVLLMTKQSFSPPVPKWVCVFMQQPLLSVSRDMAPRLPHLSFAL